jgi:hypothetical protein
LEEDSDNENELLTVDTEHNSPADNRWDPVIGDAEVGSHVTPSDLGHVDDGTGHVSCKVQNVMTRTLKM